VELEALEPAIFQPHRQLPPIRAEGSTQRDHALPNREDAQRLQEGGPAAAAAAAAAVQQTRFSALGLVTVPWPAALSTADTTDARVTASSCCSSVMAALLIMVSSTYSMLCCTLHVVFETVVILHCEQFACSLPHSGASQLAYGHILTTWVAAFHTATLPPDATLANTCG
jgi:hypothetical protein